MLIPLLWGRKKFFVLHYNEIKTVNDGDLVLVDAGCEQIIMLAISRLFATEKFSKNKEIYEIVLEASKKSIETVILRLNPLKAHETSKNNQPGLLDLKLLGDLNEVIETNKYFDFYMHRVVIIYLDVHGSGK